MQNAPFNAVLDLSCTLNGVVGMASDEPLEEPMFQSSCNVWMAIVGQKNETNTSHCHRRGSLARPPSQLWHQFSE